MKIFLDPPLHIDRHRCNWTNFFILNIHWNWPSRNTNLIPKSSKSLSYIITLNIFWLTVIQLISVDTIFSNSISRWLSGSWFLSFLSFIVCKRRIFQQFVHVNVIFLLCKKQLNKLLGKISWFTGVYTKNNTVLN